MVAHTTPQVIAPVSPTTTGKNPGLHQGISTVMDHTMEQIPKILEYPEEMHEILQISGQHPLKIQEITCQLVNRYTQIILSLTETTDMTRIGLDVSKLGLMRDTTSITLQTIISTITNHPLQFLLQDLISALH